MSFLHCLHSISHALQVNLLQDEGERPFYAKVIHERHRSAPQEILKLGRQRQLPF
jgi:hypothetical protein